MTKSRELLEAALVESRGGLDAARILLDLSVDVLGLDADALGGEPSRARPARRDLRVRPGSLAPPLDPRWYEPLRAVRLPRTTRFVAGFVHEKLALSDARRLVRVLEAAVGAPVDIAASCGLGRRTPEGRLDRSRTDARARRRALALERSAMLCAAGRVRVRLVAKRSRRGPRRWRASG